VLELILARAVPSDTTNVTQISS